MGFLIDENKLLDKFVRVQNNKKYEELFKQLYLTQDKPIYSNCIPYTFTYFNQGIYSPNFVTNADFGYQESVFVH
jgi:hypothetical protein